MGYGAAAKKHLFVILKAFGFFALWIAFVALQAVPAISDPPFIKGDSPFLRLWWELFPLLAVIIATLLFTKIVEKNRLRTGEYREFLKNGALGTALGFSWIGLAVLTAFLTGTFHWGAVNHIPYLWIWIVSALLNAAMQEYLLRGYLFALFREKYGAAPALIITTALFVLLHGGAFESGVIGVLGVLNVTTMSVFMALLLVYTKNLIAPVIAHWIWNAAGSLLGCVSLASDYPVLVNSALTGNAVLSGGQYKLEGSIIVLIINIFFIFLISVFQFMGKKAYEKRPGDLR